VKTVEPVKWIVILVQLVGYGPTGMKVTLWNVIAFVICIALWVAVGVMWKAMAIIVVHIDAFLSLARGLPVILSSIAGLYFA
jgi:hypothetical protein